MNSRLSILTIFLLLSFFSNIRAEKVFDVKKYGATPSEKTDISKALLDAWKDACSTAGAAKVLIPHAKYALREIVLEGPCKGSMTVQIKGTLTAPANPNEHHGDGWITFRHIDHLTVFGGNLDGQGKIAWEKNTCRVNVNCKPLPMNLRLDFVTNSVIQDLTSRDSKNFHMNLIGCKNVTLQRLKIKAPENSANTDGIHIGRSDGINIFDTKIGTGDDCISLGDGSRNIRITGVRCGPGHGISIGSLGKYKNEEPVSGIYVKNCELINTSNGVRIKTWPGLYSGIASDMHFQNIIMTNVSNAIFIDQMYCPWNQCKSQSSSNVKINKVTFSNIKGTSTTPTIVKLLCSKGLPCEGVELNHIDVKYTGSEGPAKSECTNVKPKIGIRSDSLRGC